MLSPFCFAQNKAMSQGGLLSKNVKVVFIKYVFYFISYAIEFQSFLNKKFKYT